MNVYLKNLKARFACWAHRHEVLLDTIAFLLILQGAVFTQSTVLRVVWSVGSLFGLYVLVGTINRRRRDNDEAAYSWTWKRADYYTGTRAMWLAELLAYNLLTFIHLRAQKRGLEWDVRRTAAMTQAAAETAHLQRLHAATQRMIESGAIDKMRDAFAAMSQAFGGARESDAAMAEREAESKMRFHSRIREERFKGHNYVTRVARDARRSLGLPLR